MEQEKIHFHSGGQRVDATLFVPEGGRKYPGVIFLHGMTSSEKNYLEIAQKLADVGVAGLTVSVRAHGTSEGDFAKLGVADGLKDAIAAYDFLAGHEFIDKTRIGICGGSLGAALAVMTSAERPVKSLLLRAPAAYTIDMMESTYEQVMADESEIFKKIENPETTPSIQAMSKFTGNLLVVTAENDQIIPAIIPNLYLSEARFAKKKELHVIKDSIHQMMDPKSREEFVNLTVHWLSKNL